MRITRLAAARHGMHLDEYGLWRWHTSEEAVLERESQSQSEFEVVSVEFEFDPDGELARATGGLLGGSSSRARARTGSSRSSSSAGSPRSAATFAF